VPWWKRRRTAVAGVAAVALASGAIAYVASRGESPKAAATTVAADSVVALDAATGRIITTAAVGRRPVGLTATKSAIWVTNSVDRSISGVDGDGRVTTISPVGAGPSAIVEAGNLLWVANVDGHSISRISPQTKTVVGDAIESGNGLSDIAYGAGAVWTTNAVDGTVWKIDADTGTVTKRTRVAPALRAIVATDEAVWTVSESAGTLIQLDPGSGAITRVVHVGNGPRAVTADGGAVWVANGFDGTVSRVDEDDGTVSATIPVGDGPRSLAFAAGNVFVANENDGTVTVIDAADNTVTHRIELGNAPMALAAAGDRVWVSVRGGILEYRGGTLRVGVPVLPGGIDPGDFDPRFAWSGFGFAVTSATHDGLVGYKRVGGLEGTTVLPDLAEEILPPTDGGRTYNFRLRPNLRYSDGSPVHASDVRATYESGFRAGAVGTVLLRSIAGADACSRKACDLSAGIVTDDDSRTVTFHLRRPNPDFLYDLAVPLAVVMPAGTPAEDTESTPVPGTGPYQLARAQGTRRQGSAVLTRNPYFHARGPAAPDGYPDRIELSWGGTPDERLAKVKSGAQDWSPYSDDASESFQRLATEVPAQFHIFDQQTVAFATLNSLIPPFDDIRVRRAVNFAVDRQAMTEAVGGSPRADVTCQVLPKDVFGYLSYCPYTLDPSASGVWSAPDLETARRLVAASGTRGERVSISFVANSPRAPSAPVLADALRKLGYRVRLNPLSAEALFRHALDNPGWQVMLDGWLGDFPSASSFLVTLLACPSAVDRLTGAGGTSVNEAHFCSPRIDQQMSAALAAQERNPLAAVSDWAAVDRQVTDAAPWVSYATFRTATVVSPRVGNVLYNPALGYLMTQMWLT
jgi:YVTN family beta-propeller protein